jgi:hypothetical protein
MMQLNGDNNSGGAPADQSEKQAGGGKTAKRESWIESIL